MNKLWKCTYCSAKIGVINKQQISNHYKSCNQYKLYKNRILTKEFLYNEYVNVGKAANQISQEIGIGVNPIIKALCKFEIPTRSVKESNNMKLYRDRINSTNLEKYGAVNPLSKNTIPYHTKNKTVLTKYGVDNVRKAPVIIDKIKKKLRVWRDENGHSTLGHKHSTVTKLKMRESNIKYRNTLDKCKQYCYNKNSISILEAKAKELGITDIQHAENGGEFQICGYFVDGYSKETNTVFEYDEKYHFRNGKLKDKNIQRQYIIMNELNCKFIRINYENKIYHESK